ncbi:MAG TPA: hypothetical protein VFB55_11470 [Verrucomicrobiae bacterium]|nr:hypothetical protein [Verrucomicrobiae bacterium]
MIAELPLKRIIRRLSGGLLWGGLLWLCPAARADVLTNFAVVNVTPASFSVVWRATNSTPSIAVFADAGGATNLAGQVGIEAYPLRTGNPALAAGYARRVDAATIRQKTQNAGLMMVRVSECRPATTYYFRLVSTPTNGVPVVFPPSGPLPSVTTAAENTFVANDRVIILDLTDPNTEGRIVLLSHTNAAHPLAAVVGDGAGPSQVFFNVNDLFALAGTGNFTPLGDQTFTLDVLEPNRGESPQTSTLTFSGDFSAAMSAVVIVNTEFLTLSLGTTVLRAGQSGSVSISSSVNTNVAGIDATLQIPPGHLTNLVLQSLAPQLDPAATVLAQQDSSTWQLHLVTLSGQTIFGSNTLAALAFTAVSNQTSAFVPLRVTALSGTKPDATPMARTLAQSGRVVVIANQPLLEAGFASDGSRQLTLYGKAWTSYAIEYSTNLNNPAGWTPTRHFAQTNMVTSLVGLAPPVPNAFYRAVEFTPDPPVLDAFNGANQARTLVGYGQPGRQYTLLAKTNLSNVVPWSPVQVFSLTNSFQMLNVSGGNSIIFYRLQRN